MYYSQEKKGLSLNINQIMIYAKNAFLLKINQNFSNSQTTSIKILGMNMYHAIIVEMSRYGVLDFSV
jgi:hypothetical protein